MNTKTTVENQAFSHWERNKPLHSSTNKPAGKNIIKFGLLKVLTRTRPIMARIDFYRSNSFVIFFYFNWQRAVVTSLDVTVVYLFNTAVCIVWPFDSINPTNNFFHLLYDGLFHVFIKLAFPSHFRSTKRACVASCICSPSKNSHGLLKIILILISLIFNVNA